MENRAAKSSRLDLCCSFSFSQMCRQSEFQKGRNHKLQHAALQLVTDHKRRTSNINQIPPFSENEGGGGGKKKCTYTSHVISWYHFTPDSLLDSLRPTRTTVSTVSRQQGSDQGRHRTEGRVRFECEDWPPGSGLDVSPPLLGAGGRLQIDMDQS